jgi:ArsR family transcriptional regulator
MVRTPIDEGTLGATAVECCAPIATRSIGKAEAEAAATVLKAIADPSRVRIVNILANSDGPVCVCDITGLIGLSQATVSFHLKKLTSAGLLERRRRGTWAYYSIRPDAMDRLAAIFESERGSE